MMKYTKVLDVMKSKGGRVAIDDPELAAVLGKQSVVGAMSAIRRLAKLDVKVIREGRKAVAYELAALAPQSAAASEQPEPAIAE